MSKHYQFRITREDARQRLDVFLASRIGQLSRIRIANLLAAGACSVNQQIEKAGYHIVVDDLVEMTLDDTVSTSMSAENIALEILHEDEQIIIVSKPSGMLVHPNKNTNSGTLANALAYHLNPQVDRVQAVVRPGLVHRLDRATSGLMVVAKTQKALSLLTKHFHKRLVKKLYLAVIAGCLEEDAGSIIAPIGQDETRRPPRWVMEEGKYAETGFRVRERRPGATLVELEPVTGRTNQLRIHCAYIGHPIIGDAVYSRLQVTGDRLQGEEYDLSVASTHDSGDLKQRDSEFVKQTDELLHPVPCPLSPVLYSRLCLHASRLEFHHPDGGQWMQFHAPLPQEIEQIWESFIGS
jgi:23S rRNA pseudouridine1911/1915/1917 synthase